MLMRQLKTMAEDDNNVTTRRDAGSLKEELLMDHTRTRRGDTLADDVGDDGRRCAREERKGEEKRRKERQY